MHWVSEEVLMQACIVDEKEKKQEPHISLMIFFVLFYSGLQLLVKHHEFYYPMGLQSQFDIHRHPNDDDNDNNKQRTEQYQY